MLRRVYPHTRAVLNQNLLSDPSAIGALMEILHSSSADGGEDAATLCTECVQFLRLVTEQDSEVRMILVFQDGPEALLAIVARALTMFDNQLTTGTEVNAA